MGVYDALTPAAYTSRPMSSHVVWVAQFYVYTLLMYGELLLLLPYKAGIREAYGILEVLAPIFP